MQHTLLSYTRHAALWVHTDTCELTHWIDAELELSDWKPGGRPKRRFMDVGSGDMKLASVRGGYTGQGQMETADP